MADERLRVAMLIQRYLPHVGGAERQLASLAPLLAERGIEVRVFTRRLRGLPARETIGGTPVVRLRAAGPKAVASLGYTAGAARALGAWRPDVVHAHELLSPATGALTAKALYGVPVVAKVLRGGEMGDVAKLRRSVNGRRRLAAIARGVDAFAVISREIDAELAAAGVPDERRRRIPNGVDVRRFAPLPEAERAAGRRRLGAADGAFVAIFCGRLAPEKRVDVLLQAWGRVLGETGAADPPQLWIVGDGPERAALEAAAPHGVRFLGEVDDVAPLLPLADAFVLPSDAEGLSNAMLEAMAAGLPVIATRVGGAEDLVGGRRADPDDPDVPVGGPAGFLVPPGHAAAMGVALHTLATDPLARAHLGETGRRRTERDYALPIVADRLAALYRELAAARRATGAQRTRVRGARERGARERGARERGAREPATGEPATGEPATREELGS